MLDKKKILQRLSEIECISLDLGCGHFKKNPGWIGVDVLDIEGVDIVGDVYEVIRLFPDNSVDEIHAFHFFEHIPDIPALLMDLNRVLKQTGFIEVVVPHFSNPYYYSDYTHKNFFGLYSFSYMVKDTLLQRRVPDYNVNTGLQLKSVFLRFKSPFLINRPFRMFWQFIFNSSISMKEWYEDSWSSNLPCHEIQFILIKL